MSQRSRINRSSQRINKSQNASSSQTERFSQSQLSPPQSQSQNVRNVPNDLVEKCVRFFIVKLGTNIPIKRAQVVQALFSERPGKTFDIVLQKAKDVLLEVYGLKLGTIDADTNSKKYIVTNNLEHSDIVVNSEEENLKTTITFLVLTHIFMSKDSATESSLWEFLKGLNILPEKKLTDVGDVHTLITKQLVKEQYIQLETNGTTSNNDDEESRNKFSWGSRAKDCVSKFEILKFVAKVYGNVNIKNWSSRYEDAVQQPGFGDSDNVEMMEVDD